MSLGYKTPVVEISKSETRQRRYEVEKDKRGWFQHDILSDLWNKDAQETRITFDKLPAAYLMEEGSRPVNNFVCVDRQHLKGVIMKPWMSKTMTLAFKDKVRTRTYAADGTLIDDAGGTYDEEQTYWESQWSEDGLFWEYAQQRTFDDDGDPVWSQVIYDGPLGEDEWTTVGACPNVFFVAGIRRKALSQDVLDYMDSEGYGATQWSEIGFGDGRWALVVPLEGEPFLAENATYRPSPPGWEGDWPAEWVPLEWTEGGLSDIDAESLADDGVTYKIGVIGNAICVTESSFEDDFAYYVVRNSGQPVCAAGNIEILSWPGQATYRLQPCRFISTLDIGECNRIYRHPFPITTSTAREEHIDHGVFGSPVIGYDYVDGNYIDYVGGGGVGEYEGYYQYWIEVYPGLYPSYGEVTDQNTMTTPTVEAVSTWQEAEVTDHGEQTFGEIDRERFELGVRSEELGKSTSQRHDLTLDNRLSTDDPPEGDEGRVPTEDYTLGRMIKTEAGWAFTSGAEGTKQLGDFIIVGAQRDSKYAAFGVTDMLGMLALSQWDSGSLNFRAWDVTDAIEFVLKAYGIGSEWYELEDLGLTLSGATDWEFKDGTSVADILAKLADQGGGGAAIWYDGHEQKIRTGCKYCGTKRTSDNWQSHQDNGWNSSGCRAADFERNADGYDVAIVDTPDDADDQSSLYMSQQLTARIDAIDAQQYANRITVVGQSENGRDISATWEDDDALHDPTSDRYTGIPICKVEENSTLKTRDAVNERLVELVHELSAWPLRVEIAMPFYSVLRPGYVAKVEGGKYAGLHDELFRIQRIAHDVGQRATRLTARHLEDVDTSDEE